MAAGTFRVKVSNNRVDYSLAHSGITLKYLDDFVIKTISLSRIHIDPYDSVDMEVTGDFLPSYSSDHIVYCIISPGDANSFEQVVITAIP